MRILARWPTLCVFLLACGAPPVTAEAGPPASDAGATDAALFDGGSTPIDASTPLDASTPVTDSGADASLETDAGRPAESCTDGDDDDGDGLIDCADSDCFEAAEYPADDLLGLGLERFTRCPSNSTQAFTVEESRAVCSSGSSLVSGWSYRCDRVDFEGTLTFFCPPAPTSGNDSLVVRYDVTAIPVADTMEGRMSLDVTTVARRESTGDGHRHVAAGASGTPSRFIGYHWIGNIGAADGTATTDVWFRVASRGTDFGGGGFHVDVDMARLR